MADVSTTDRDEHSELLDADARGVVPKGDAGYFCRVLPAHEFTKVIFRGSDQPKQEGDG